MNTLESLGFSWGFGISPSSFDFGIISHGNRWECSSQKFRWFSITLNNQKTLVMFPCAMWRFWLVTLRFTSAVGWHPTPILLPENPMDGGAWWAAVHGVARSRTQLSDFTFPSRFHALEKEMATHSSVLAWRIPGTGEPGGLPSVGSHRVGHDWSDLAAAAAAAALWDAGCF